MIFTYIIAITYVHILLQWAFGVTCWEIFSLGLQPYPSIDPFEIANYIKGRRVLEKPSLSSDKM